MYEGGGRSRHSRDRARDMDARHHLYGQQLGWHALFFVAGEFLTKYATFQRPYGACDSWDEWLGRELLTRSDGLWLADGIDRPPLDAETNLYEKGETGLVITGNKRKLLAPLGIRSSEIGDLVVGGYWHSNDNVEIRVGSALVRSYRHDRQRSWRRALPRRTPSTCGSPGSRNTKTARSFLTPRKNLMRPGLCGRPLKQDSTGQIRWEQTQSSGDRIWPRS
jgi:hypothetical protein